MGLRPAAEEDLVEETQWLRTHAGKGVAVRFLDAALSALDVLGANPGIGSPRAGQDAGIPGLRAWAIEGFHARWYYLDGEHATDVVRLLGDRQDLRRLLREDLD